MSCCYLHFLEEDTKSFQKPYYLIIRHSYDLFIIFIYSVKHCMLQCIAGYPSE